MNGTLVTRDPQSLIQHRTYVMKRRQESTRPWWPLSPSLAVPLWPCTQLNLIIWCFHCRCLCKSTKMWWILLFLSTSPLFSGAKFEDESLERYHMRKKTSCNFNVTPSTDSTLLWSPSPILWQEAKKTKYRAHVSGRLQPWRSAKGFVGLYCPLSCRNILRDILVALCCFQWGRDCHEEDFNGVLTLLRTE